ncbi:apolipoprotein A1/A4/E family protein [Klebsiella pneumoniae subsp. pneumoniae]|nr:apolipoprotein A1/A4/E family protein [Klebsiella pneumoniae subsp. pneumoniae]
MPIYTDDPGTGINQPLSNVESGLGESLSASFTQGFREGPLMSGIRFAQADQYANDPNSPVVSKAEADAKLKELGVKSINIPDSGVTQSFMDHVTQERKEALARQQIASSAPSGFISTPLNFMAGLAGSMADPANLAIGLVPFAGEARAATALGRFGERFVQGSIYGGVQTAAAIPFTALAAAAEGDNFTLAQGMENIFLGMVGGGVLHAGGGVIADLVRGRRGAEPSASIADEAGTLRATESPQTPLSNEANFADLDSYVYSRAYDDITPAYQAELNATRDSITSNLDDVKSGIEATRQQISDIESSLERRVSEYKSQGMKSRDARAQAKQDIADERTQVQERQGELQQELEKHIQASRAEDELGQIDRGDIPPALRERIAARAAEIGDGFKPTAIAQGVRTAAQRINEANWTQRENAFRGGLSHMLQGRTPDIEPFFDLGRTDLRAAAFDQIKQGPRPDIDEPTVRASADADTQYKRAQNNDDLINAQEDFDAEIELARNMVDDLDSPAQRGVICHPERSQ